MGVILLPPRIKNEHNWICFFDPGHIVDFIFIFFLLRFDLDTVVLLLLALLFNFECVVVNVVEFVHDWTDKDDGELICLLLLNILLAFERLIGDKGNN